MRFLICCLFALGTIPATCQNANSPKPTTAPQSPRFTTLYTFTAGADSAHPLGCSLALDAHGNLFGVNDGLQINQGIAYELSPPALGSIEWTFTSVFQVAGFFGSPDSCLLLDAEGNLYGEASDGGNCAGGGCGEVFELSLDGSGGWQGSIIYVFQGGEDGAWPTGGLVLDSAGNLYGETQYGGGSGARCQQGGCGTVFKLAQGNGAWTETVLHRFGNNADGEIPFGGLVFDGVGNLYGTVESGGVVNGKCIVGYPGCGAVFELSPNQAGEWTEKALHLFTGGADGNSPSGGVAFDRFGNLFGTTSFGGAEGDGTVFELVPAGGSWNHEALHYFKGSDGSSVYEGVVLNGAGNVYGTTESGGSGTHGVVYELSRTTGGKWEFSLLHSFDGSDGYAPSQLIIDSQGHLFGATNGGGADNDGTIFTVKP